MKAIQSKLSNMDRFVVSHAQAKLQSMKKNAQRGAGAVEYALVMAVVVTLVIGVAGAMEGNLKTFFEEIGKKVKEFLG